MTTTRDGSPSSTSPEVAEASSFPGVRGMRWWTALLLALVLTAGSVAADVVRDGSLGVVFLAAYPAGCVLATLLIQRRDLFVAMVQPPLLLAVSVPVAVAATGSLPASGGLASTALAVGAPLINGFPAMAITTVVCVVIGVVRIRTQRWQRDDGTPGGEPAKSGSVGGAARDRGSSRDGRRPASDERGRREAAGADRDQAERERRRAQERARAERDRGQAERDRDERERRERERAERDRGRRDGAAPEPGPEARPAARRSGPPPERGTPAPERSGSGPPPERSGPPPERSGPPPERSGPPPERSGPPPERSGPPPERGGPPPKRPGPAGDREPRSREDRMREERLREERRNGPPPPPGVHPVRGRRRDGRA